ncbi:pyridoxal phosphate-dependent decarboxylase family protein [Derxia gummosa]|uniref:Pyridoxal phosphate-dependent decarboxylase family protein n=1 Tax=Derxia gummosa DSM 723 TaxID=1121388 RepID=A0A9U5CJ40_9BURK|nr:pyridoxal-dependent decarboxylase [Derxia gummosa]
MQDRADAPGSPESATSAAPAGTGRPVAAPASLDPASPADWSALREQGHRMLDDLFDHLAGLRDHPVWQPLPPGLRAAWREPLPHAPMPLDAAHARFMAEVLPHSVGNAHPRFMGWVQGGGTAVGMLAEMLAAGLNANVGGRDQMPLEVEKQIVCWMRELFGFPATAGGLFVTGSSMANFLGVLIARTKALGAEVRRLGLQCAVARGGIAAPRLVGYAGTTAHGCLARGFDMAGLGTAALRRIPVDADHRIDLTALAAQIALDRAAGLHPFMVVGTAGTVDIGAIDPLAELAELAARERLWFHVDGAFGALGMLSREVAPMLAGIERADSIALDFHKWGQVPYDAGFILVRDQADQLATFAAPADYLARSPRGLAAGSPWPCDLGPDLSRGFRALKTWFTFATYGADALGAVIDRSRALAQALAARIEAEPALELLAPVTLNIVCFRHRGARAADGAMPAATATAMPGVRPADAARASTPESAASSLATRHADAVLADALDGRRASALDRLNADIVADLHEAGIAVPSTTVIDGRLAIRAALVNHRTDASDIDALVDAVLARAAARLASPTDFA